MADRSWLTQLTEKRSAAREAAQRQREREQKTREARELLIDPFWEAFAAECDGIVRQANAPIGIGVRLTRKPPHVISVSFENQTMVISVLTNPMSLHVAGMPGGLIDGTLKVAGDQILGASGETPEDLANTVMRAFLERAPAY